MLPLVCQASSSYVNTMRILWKRRTAWAPFLFCQALPTLRIDRHQQILTSTNDWQQIQQQSKHINNFDKHKQMWVDMNGYQQISTQSAHIYIYIYISLSNNKNINEFQQNSTHTNTNQKHRVSIYQIVYRNLAKWVKLFAQMATERNIAKRSTRMWWVFAIDPEWFF